MQKIKRYGGFLAKAKKPLIKSSVCNIQYRTYFIFIVF